MRRSSFRPQLQDAPLEDPREVLAEITPEVRHPARATPPAPPHPRHPTPPAHGPFGSPRLLAGARIGVPSCSSVTPVCSIWHTPRPDCALARLRQVPEVRRGSATTLSFTALSLDQIFGVRDAFKFFDSDDDRKLLRGDFRRLLKRLDSVPEGDDLQDLMHEIAAGIAAGDGGYLDMNGFMEILAKRSAAMRNKPGYAMQARRSLWQSPSLLHSSESARVEECV